MKYYIAYNETGTLHYVQVPRGQKFSSGQPTIEEYNDFEDWIDRLEILGVDVSDIEKEEEEVIETVSRVQFFLALKFYMWNEEPLEGQVDTLINALPEPEKTIAQTKFDQATTFRITDPYLIQLSTALGMDSNDLEDFFYYAYQERWHG